MTARKVLITGAYGLVGNVALRRLAASPESFDVYGMVRRRAPSARIPTSDLYSILDEKLRVADLTDFAAVREAVSGMDCVVHMAADPDEDSPWESIHANNVVGAYNVLEACRLAGVKRVVCASTVQVIFGYRDTEPYGSLMAGRFEDVSLTDLRPLRHDQPTRPLSFYASSKVWVEALAHMYAHTHGLSCLCVRIGWVTAEDRVPERWGESAFCSRRDIAQVIERCVAAPHSLRFDVFFGVSANRYMLVDIEHTRQVLGYAPGDGYR